MYFVVNTTDRELMISDLNISLGPRKAMDIEKLKPRYIIEESKDLKTCIKTKRIQVRHDSKLIDSQKADQVEGQTNDDQINQIKNVIANEIKQQLSGFKGQSSGDNTEIMSILNKLTEAFEKGTVPIISKVESSSTDHEDNIDEERLSEIHARKMQKLSKNTNSRFTHEEKKSADSVADRVSELDDLLG